MPSITRHAATNSSLKREGAGVDAGSLMDANGFAHRAGSVNQEGIFRAFWLGADARRGYDGGLKRSLSKKVAAAGAWLAALSCARGDWKLETSEKLAAAFKAKNDKAKPLTWPDSSVPELQRMLYYDSACGGAYIATESDFPYRPSALFVMDGLIEVCVEVRTRIV